MRVVTAPQVNSVERRNVTSANAGDPSGAASDDKRLERLFDYTKFHMSIYLSATGGLMTIVSLAADKTSFVGRLIGWPLGLLLALVSMLIAGVAGGVVASSATLSRTFEELWDSPQGPFSWRWFPGRVWATIEHFSFWLSIALASASVLSAPAVIEWLWSSH
jgi:hypothetical protein